MKNYLEFINEEFVITNKIMNIFKQHNIEIPNTDEKITIDLSDVKNKIKLAKGNRQPTLTDLNQTLRKMFPASDLPDDKLKAIVNDINSIILKSMDNEDELNGYIFKEMTPFEMYQIAGKTEGSFPDISSCINWEGLDDEEGLKIFDNPDIKGLVAYNKDGKPIGRCLLWSGLIGLDRPFMDRVYDDSRSTQLLFRDYAIKKSYYYRIKVQECGFNGNKISKKFSYIVDNWNKLSVVPYMDTLVYGDKEKGVISNYPLVPISNERHLMFDDNWGTEI